jgi:hypothetical protein
MRARNANCCEVEWARTSASSASRWHENMVQRSSRNDAEYGASFPRRQISAVYRRGNCLLINGYRSTIAGIQFSARRRNRASVSSPSYCVTAGAEVKAARSLRQLIFMTARMPAAVSQTAAT